MPGTIKIWYHDGAVKDRRYNDIPVLNEPELALEALVSDGTGPVATLPAPEGAAVAIVESDVNVRYVVRAPGDTRDADPETSKPLAATGHAVDSIGVRPGFSISFVEV